MSAFSVKPSVLGRLRAGNLWVSRRSVWQFCRPPFRSHAQSAVERSSSKIPSACSIQVRGSTS